MLEKLFGSNARVKILKLFLLNPDKKYYIRQLARDLKLQLNSVRRELENLEQFGLLVSSASRDDESGKEDEAQEIQDLKEGKVVVKKPKETSASSKQEKKYYQANKNFILFSEVQALFIKAQVLYEEDFIKKLSQAGSLKLFVLTGFFVGAKNVGVDILAVGLINKEKFAKLVVNLEKELGRELNYAVMNSQEFKFRRDMTDVFLYQILEADKVVVIDEIGI